MLFIYAFENVILRRGPQTSAACQKDPWHKKGEEPLFGGVNTQAL